MNEYQAVWDNLEFFLTRLRALPPCQAMDMGGRGFCLSTRSESASENWAFLPGALADDGTAGAAARFFEERGLPFVWPLFQDAPAQAALLEAAGLREAGRLLAMSRDAGAADFGGNAPKDLTFQAVQSSGDAARWARSAWLGFGGEDPTPANFIELAEAMGDDPSLVLMAAQEGGEDLGTFLLALGRDAGVYYFAVRPTCRRRGVAMAMMGETLAHARRTGRPRIVLQATPAGVPFYRAAGFGAHGEIPLFSTEEDVF